MINVVSFSGGRTSAFLVYLMKQRDPDCKFIYCDTGAEHPKTYAFIRDVVREFNIDLICLRAKFSEQMGVGATYQVVSLDSIAPDLVPWREMMAKYSTPYLGGANCTRDMKTTPFKKYCDQTFGRNQYTIWLGIRSDEPKRLREKEGIRYLAEIDESDKEDILSFWRGQSFDLDLPEYLGNCVFCIKKGANKIALAQRVEPEMASDFIAAIESDAVKDTRSSPKELMYRGHHSLRSIIKLYDGVSNEEIASTIKSLHQYDSGSCSESCEAFGCQLDLF
jgi:hypothetical protein